MNAVAVKMVRGYESYSVVVDGKAVATAHCVQVVNRTYSVNVNGMWRGALPEADAVAYLKNLDLSAKLDTGARRALLGA